MDLYGLYGQVEEPPLVDLAEYRFLIRLGKPETGSWILFVLLMTETSMLSKAFGYMGLTL